MSSDRAHPVRYSLKGTSQPKIRPLNSSTRSSGDLFDKLKSSVASKSAAPSSSMPKPTFKDPVESENYERKSANYSFKYTYSHSPRSQVKVSNSSLDSSSTPPRRSQEQSPTSRPVSNDESVHGSEVSEKKEDARKKDLKVFDFDMSGDEDNVSEGGSGLKKAKVNHRGSTHSKQPVMSKKQTLLHQYMNVQSTTGSSSRGVSKKSRDRQEDRTVKTSDGVTRKQAKNGQTADDHSVRDTISKLLASKAEELVAKASVQERRDSCTSPDAMADTTSATVLDETTAPVNEEASGSINRRIKRRNPLTTTAAAAKKAPPKRAKIERESDNEIADQGLPDRVNSLAASVSGLSALQSESSQTNQSGVKKNGLKSTLERSEIAMRTRSSRKSQGHVEIDQKMEGLDDAALSGSQPSSIADSDVYSPSHQDTELDLKGSPMSSMSSTSEVSRGGRPSPRYTARGRRMSNLSPDVGTEQAMTSPSTMSGLGVGMRLAKAKQVGDKGSESDPYSLECNEDYKMDKAFLKKQHLVPPKPSLKKSSSAGAYSLTSHSGHPPDSTQPSSLSRVKQKAVPLGQRSQVGPAASDKTDVVPSLTKSSSWPHRPRTTTRTASSESSSIAGSKRLLSKSSLIVSSTAATTGVTCAKDEKQLYTVIRNVRQAHECLEIGESQQFFDEAHYLLDSIKPSQPLSVRCLGAFNLSTHYFDPEFSRQLRAHSFTPKITSLLKDCLQHPTLCLSAAVLFYVMTRDKLNTEWDDNGAALLVGMLSKEESFFTSELSTGKAQREMTRLRAKAKTILQKAQEQTSLSPSSSQTAPSDEDPSSTSVSVVRGGVEGLGGDARDRGDILKEKPHFVNMDNVSVQELACECLISLTHHQHNPQWLRHQLRLLGGLDLVANLVISSIEDISSVDVMAFTTSSQTNSTCDYATGINNRLATLERRLKALEHATIRNKDNQSYLVVFDGSILLSKIICLVAVFQNLMKHEPLRTISEHCLLTAFKVLLNLTHEFQLGCYRLGEQRDVMLILLDVLFQLSDKMTDEDNAFDVTVLTLSLLINLTEMCGSNRTSLETTKAPWIDTILTGTQDTLVDDAIYGRDSSLRALVQLFLKRFTKAESTQIQVPTPQRLSQLPSSSPAQASPNQNPQPHKVQPSISKRDLLSTFTSRMQKASVTTSLQSSSQEDKTQSSQNSDGLKWLDEDPTGSGPKTDERVLTTDGSESDEEAIEEIKIDPLVFSREEFDAALHQAGRHMEDSIIAAYTALLLGILSKHNQDTLNYVRSHMPSRSFSEMIEILKKLVSFMNMTGSATGLESIRHIIKYLEGL